MNKFGKRIRELRNAKGYSLRQLAPLVGVGFTYLSKVENGKLDFGDAPSANLIGRLAEVLGSDTNDLMLLAGRIPMDIERRIFEQPAFFKALSMLSDADLAEMTQRLTTNET